MEKIGYDSFEVLFLELAVLWHDSVTPKVMARTQLETRHAPGWLFKIGVSTYVLSDVGARAGYPSRGFGPSHFRTLLSPVPQSDPFFYGRTIVLISSTFSPLVALQKQLEALSIREASVRTMLADEENRIRSKLDSISDSARNRTRTYQ